MKTNNAIIFTALPLEFEAVRAHLGSPTVVTHPKGTIYEVGTFVALDSSIWRIAIVQTGPGNVRAAIEAERAVSHFDPSHVFFVGVAGGLKDVALGDVVAATKIYGFESGKAEKTFLPRPEIGESSYDLVQQANRVARAKLWHGRILPRPLEPPNAFVAPIAAGEKLVASTSSEVFLFLRQSFSDAVAVEMEGFGFLRAGYANGSVRMLVVRGISDLIEKKSESDAAGSQVTASANAAAFVFEVLANLITTSNSPSRSGRASEDLERWARLENVAAELYPKGPTDTEIWSRAGGNIALIDVTQSGRAAWHAALRKLQQGGGGNTISLDSLLSSMLSDFPKHSGLRAFGKTLV